MKKVCKISPIFVIYKRASHIIDKLVIHFWSRKSKMVWGNGQNPLISPHFHPIFLEVSINRFDNAYLFNFSFDNFKFITDFKKQIGFFFAETGNN